MDSAWEHYKLEARKMLENGDESRVSSAPMMSKGKLILYRRTAVDTKCDHKLRVLLIKSVI